MPRFLAQVLPRQPRLRPRDRSRMRLSAAFVLRGQSGSGTAPKDGRTPLQVGLPALARHQVGNAISSWKSFPGSLSCPPACGHRTCACGVLLCLNSSLSLRQVHARARCRPHTGSRAWVRKLKSAPLSRMLHKVITLQSQANHPCRRINASCFTGSTTVLPGRNHDSLSPLRGENS